eukprot:4307561-Prymnesium_polylepis.1
MGAKTSTLLPLVVSEYLCTDNVRARLVLSQETSEYRVDEVWTCAIHHTARVVLAARQLADRIAPERVALDRGEEEVADVLDALPLQRAAPGITHKYERWVHRTERTLDVAARCHIKVRVKPTEGQHIEEPCRIRALHRVSVVVVQAEQLWIMLLPQLPVHLVRPQPVLPVWQ